MTEQLKPCPFCGGVGRHFVSSSENNVHCQDCGANVHYMTWNNRPYENKIKADAVREALNYVMESRDKKLVTTSSLELFAENMERGDV